MITGQSNDYDDLNADPLLLHKAFEMSRGDDNQISELINQTLRAYINQTKLETLGYRETLFHLAKYNEVKKLFVKPIAKHEIKHDLNTHLNDPNFCGVIYPSAVVEVFMTPKGNILMQKSVDREIHFCNGVVIRDHTSPRIMEFKVLDHADSIRRELPDLMHASVTAVLNSKGSNRLLKELDRDFIDALEL
ncbi:hypothetical protein [Paenibacillus sp. URB8-2]|uniref:hypothetical protein n=1 Tax=Paenibacillus sp. URB8-2 TaxID=2741301 RepID=UPI0015BBDC34|nr:hypothetical protein [Paenibacillus sp. URB8-2]BCG60396.1 hypothetical protein PUR_38210 [Paenibacillus sp. URB8-2]